MTNKWEDYFLKLSSDNHSNVMIANSLELKKSQYLKLGSWWGKEENL